MPQVYGSRVRVARLWNLARSLPHPAHLTPLPKETGHSVITDEWGLRTCDSVSPMSPASMPSACTCIGHNIGSQARISTPIRMGAKESTPHTARRVRGGTRLGDQGETVENDVEALVPRTAAAVQRRRCR